LYGSAIDSKRFANAFSFLFLLMNLWCHSVVNGCIPYNPARDPFRTSSGNSSKKIFPPPITMYFYPLSWICFWFHQHIRQVFWSIYVLSSLDKASPLNFRRILYVFHCVFWVDSCKYQIFFSNFIFKPLSTSANIDNSFFLW
jgi:hypothetical protein